MRLALDLAILAAVVGVTTLVAELAGAANLGVSLGIAQIAFAAALVALMLRGSRRQLSASTSQRPPSRRSSSSSARRR